jgi:hypothetical protein
MKEKILEYLKLKADKVGVTPPELIRAVDGRGDFSLELTGMNIVYVWGASTEFLDALEELQRTKQVGIGPTSLLVWLADGFRGPTLLGQKKPLPIARQENVHKTLHWCPVLVDLYDGPFAKAVRAKAGIVEGATSFALAGQSMTEETPLQQ